MGGGEADEFLRCKAYCGSKRGYVFKAGKLGLGYYRRVCARVCVCIYIRVCVYAYVFCAGSMCVCVCARARACCH